MRDTDFNRWCSERVPGVCPACGKTPDPVNGWWCPAHAAEVDAMIRAENAEREKAQRSKRSRAAKEAAKTRKLADGSRFRNGVREPEQSFSRWAWGQRRYAEIRSKMARR